LRQGIGLIESAGGKPAAMQRDWDEEIGLDQKFVAGAGHPSPERFG
jgi:hypothetical protein